MIYVFSFFFSSRRRHTRCLSDWSSDVCSSDLPSAASPSSCPGTCQATLKPQQPDGRSPRHRTLTPEGLPRGDQRGLSENPGASPPSPQGAVQPCAGDDTDHRRGHHADMSLFLDLPPPPSPPEKPKLSA